MQKKKILKNTYLSDLKEGQKCKVLFLSDNLLVKHHFLEMGIVKNTIIEVKKIAPFGSPFIIHLRNYNLCIRKNDIKNIYVEIL